MFYQLEQFGFRALWSPYLFIFIVLVIGGFFYLAIKKRHLFEGNEPLTKNKQYYLSRQHFLYTF